MGGDLRRRKHRGGGPDVESRLRHPPDNARCLILRNGRPTRAPQVREAIGAIPPHARKQGGNAGERPISCGRTEEDVHRRVIPRPAWLAHVMQAPVGPNGQVLMRRG